jgi:hypothetical protein
MIDLKLSSSRRRLEVWNVKLISFERKQSYGRLRGSGDTLMGFFVKRL